MKHSRHTIATYYGKLDITKMSDFCIAIAKALEFYESFSKEEVGLTLSSYSPQIFPSYIDGISYTQLTINLADAVLWKLSNPKTSLISMQANFQRLTRPEYIFINPEFKLACQQLLATKWCQKYDGSFPLYWSDAELAGCMVKLIKMVTRYSLKYTLFGSDDYINKALVEYPNLQNTLYSTWNIFAAEFIKTKAAPSATSTYLQCVSQALQKYEL